MLNGDLSEGQQTGEADCEGEGFRDSLLLMRDYDKNCIYPDNNSELCALQVSVGLMSLACVVAAQKWTWQVDRRRIWTYM